MGDTLIDDNLINEAAEAISRSRRSVALTGAGISVESVIPPFRGKGGLWEKYDPMEYATIDAFLKDPEKVWRVLLMATIDQLRRAVPNNGHLGLARLEAADRLGTVITQNVDGLHQRAGSRDVIEFHGSFASFRCLRCDRTAGLEDIDLSVLPPPCQCGGIYRPDCVFFGERIPPQHLERSHVLAGQCQVMLVVGTSATVQPASDLPLLAKHAGAIIIEINPEKTPLTRGGSDIFLQGKAGAVMDRLAAEVERRT
jgi:NAD-dependent deacetylase